MPVNFAAFSSNSSSMFIVVLMNLLPNKICINVCINLYSYYVFVKKYLEIESMAKPYKQHAEGLYSWYKVVQVIGYATSERQRMKCNEGYLQVTSRVNAKESIE